MDQTHDRRDRFDLQRFVTAQDDGGTYERAVGELRQGRKTSHWIWFVFPQIAGLGFSTTSVRYAISGLDEARAFLDHPVLGPRLVECATIVAETRGHTASEIFGAGDARKLHSSMTLFLRTAPEYRIFSDVLDRCFDGMTDSATDDQIRRNPDRA